MPGPARFSLFAVMSTALACSARPLATTTDSPTAASPPSSPSALDSGDSEAIPVNLSDEAESPVVTLVSDTTCTSPCTFRTGGSAEPARVVYRADSWEIGESSDEASGFAIMYDFHDLGDRRIEVTAYDPFGQVLGRASAWIEVVGAADVPDADPTPELPEVPYFYQYDNSLYPGSTCQNTVIAMVLAWQGWDGDPDVITGYWGKDHAQTPEGLSEVLTLEAAYWGLSVHSVPHTSASFDDLRTLLDRGLPVPIHGYFTSYGHVVLALGYDADGYWVHDPAGDWDGRFMGGYPSAYAPTVGAAIHIPKAAFEAAVGTSDGTTPLPLWLHEVTP